MPPKTRLPGIQIRETAAGLRYRPRINRRGVTAAPTFADLGEAVRWREQAIRATDSGQPLPSMPGEEARGSARRAAAPARTLTVKDSARRFIAGAKSGQIRTDKGRVYKPATIRKYEVGLRLDINPHLGAVKVAALRRGDIQHHIDWLAAERGVEQALTALAALRAVIHSCQRYEEVDAADRTLGVKVPRREKTPSAPRVLTAEERMSLLAAANADDAGTVHRPARSFIGPLAYLALESGLRSGELLGLRWGRDGLDLDAGLVHVTQAIDRTLDRGTAAYPAIPPKSEASRRTVPIEPEAVQVMRQHRLATGRPADGALVWAREDGRPLGAGGKLRDTWERVRKAAGIEDLGLHDLRHTYATHLLASGVSVHAVAALLGHADAGLVLRRYGHALPAELASSGERLATWRAAQRGQS
jgi:integrase